MGLRTGRIRVAVSAGLLWLAAAGSPAQVPSSTSVARPLARPPTEVTPAMQDAAAGQTQNWLHVNGNYEQTRYFPGNQINAGNVRRLVPAFVFQTGIVDALATAPVVVNGIMYVTTARDEVYALDAASGDEFWHYRHRELPVPAACCVDANQGIAIAGGRVYLGTRDAQLVALDAQTGRVVWSTPVADPDSGVATTMAPVVADARVIVGVDVGASGRRGFVKAFAVADGQLLWSFATIPETGNDGVYAPRDPLGRDLHRDLAAEKAAYAKDAGLRRSLGGGVAMTPAVDRNSRTLFVAVGRPAPAYYGVDRPGDNLYTDSLVALDLDRGTLRWHFQYVPHDLWGLDAASPPVLAQARDITGKRIDVVVHAGKTGNLYIHERATGRLIRASEPMIATENLYAVPTTSGERMIPGTNGGVERSPLAVNPILRLAYAANIRQPMNYRVDTTPTPDGGVGAGGAATLVPGEESDGRLVAVNLDTGRIAWRVRTASPLLGGALATAGELVFHGAGNFLRAWDAKTGEDLWRFDCGAGVNAPPVSYMVGRKQYVAVAAGGNARIDSKRGNAIVVFALP